MTYKKINIKKFLSKFSQNELISQLFKINDAKNVPHIMDTPDDGKISKENVEEWYAFYLGLDDERRVTIYEAIEKINYISNFDAYQIIESFKPRKSDGEKILTANDILAETYNDKALAFYLDQEESKKESKIEDVIHIYSFYKISGYKRYEAKDNVKDIKKVDENIAERFEAILEAQMGTYVKVDSKTIEYDNMYFTKIIYTDAKEKEFNFVYIKEVGEVLVKAVGSKQVVFEYAENYIKKLTGYAMDPKEPQYYINIFVDKNYKKLFTKENSEEYNKNGLEKADNKISTNINLKYPLDDDNLIYDWYIKSVKLSRKINTISFNFSKSDEVKNMTPLYVTLLESNIDINTYNIESISVVASVKTVNVKSKTVKKNISINIKENSTNLNILKKEHRAVDKLLKDKKIFVGYKVIELQNKK